ncbi:MAG: DUF1684 domain-containing protein [Cytophagales bacterium]|nr:DUF1684 domain-containing protein [Cytophagales bacterium]
MIKYQFLAFLFILACTPAPKQATSEQLSGWESWKVDRMEELKSKEGFLNLAGLYWLQDGEHSFGSDSSNAVIFPVDFPAKSGVFKVEAGVVSISEVAEGILIDSTSQEEGLVFDLSQEVSKEMTYGNYVWYIIERVGNVGIRLKDLDHPMLAADPDIHFYEYNPDLVVEAIFKPYLPKKKLTIDNVLGHRFEMEIEGQLQFQFQGKNYSLEPLDDVDFFVIFSDETSAIETYGSGRYLHVPLPGPDGKTTIDFNRAYNPPCAFTDFATCLIPPSENRLDFRVDGGELDFHME